MKISRLSRIVLFSLVAMLVVYAHAPAGSSRLASNIKAIQSEIQNAHKAFAQFRKITGGSTKEFDAAIKRLGAKIKGWNASLKDPAQGYASSKGLSQNTEHLNEYFSSLEKERSQSKWRAVERDLARLDSAAKDLYSAALNLPDAPRTSARRITKPPAPGPSGTEVSPAGPKPRPEPGKGIVGPDNPPPPVTRRGPSPKGPDDPRFAAAPYPPVPPHPTPDDPSPPEPPPPPPDDGGAYSGMPSPMDGPAGKGAPPMLRKPARPPVKIQEDIPKPKPPHTRKQISQPRTKGGTEDPKIQNFLSALGGANSLVEVRKAYEKGNFTESEIANLEQHVLKSGYGNKLQAIAEREKQKTAVAIKKDVDSSISVKRNALARKQQQELQKRNNQALKLLQEIKSQDVSPAPGATVARKFKKESSETVEPSTRAIDMEERRANLPPKEEFGEILKIEGTISWHGDGWFADVGETEGHTIITGNYFGDVEGEVDFLPISLRDQRRILPMSVSSWSEHRIVAEFPPSDEVEGLLGYGRHQGMVRVIRRGNTSGPQKELTLYARQPPPRITGTSVGIPGNITPGQEILIMGERFTPLPDDTYYDYSPRVELQHNGPTGSRIVTNLTVWEYHDTWIRALLGSSIEGVPESRGILKVIRAVDYDESEIEINFQPTLSTFEFVEERHHQCWGFFGFKNTVTLHDYSLKNGWSVVNHEVRKSGIGGHGCEWLERPNIGSTETKARLEYWCNLFSRISCTSELTIEGPAGMHW